MEDNFATDRSGEDGFGMIQMYYIQAHLLLYGPVPNKTGLEPVQSPEVGDPCFGHNKHFESSWQSYELGAIISILQARKPRHWQVK